MRWNWIFVLIVIVSCSETKSPRSSEVKSKALEMKGLASMLPTKVDKDTVAPKVEEEVIVEEKVEEAVIEEKTEKPTEDKKRPSLVDEVPMPKHGELIIEPPIDFEGFNSLEEYYAAAFEGKHEYLTDGFDYPVGRPNMRGYYIAQKYQTNRHLGDDFNAVTGGNTDLGDPVYAIGNGIVTFAYDLKGGWGNTVRIVHRHPVGEMVESLYSHLDEINVNFGDYVKRGDLIGTIGTAHGLYPAHLHLEVRTQVNLELGRGYSDDPEGYTAPTPFIRANRPRW